jgi:predicted DNA-binding transcriptional regulator AlpA
MTLSATVAPKKNGLNAFFKDETMSSQNNKPQLLTAKALAKILSLSPRSVWRLRSAQKVPRPVNVGASVRWVSTDIDKWISLGCPPQRDFEALAD